MSDGVDYITILRCRKPGARATKTHTWQPDRQSWATASYDGLGTFSCHTAQVDGIQSLGAAIDDIRKRPELLVIRGELKEGRDASNVRRKYAGADDPFKDVPRPWVMFDIDGWPIPDGLDLIEDTVAIIERAIAALLSEPFHDCSAFWQLSSSAGFKPSSVLRAHLWFWLDRRVETLPLKAWVETNCGALVDRALINAVQIHYTADPVVIGGPDPIQHRTGWIEGERDFATLPDLSAAISNSKAFRAAGSGMSASQAETVEGILAEMGDNDDGSLRGFHTPIRDAAWRYATITPPWDRDAEALKARIRGAIEAAPKNRGRDTDIANYTSDSYLDGNIRGAFLKVPTAGGWEACTPEHSLPNEGVEEARTRMSEAIRAFLAAPNHVRLTGSLPRRGLVISEVGLGKTERGLRAIGDFIGAAKAKGKPHRVIYAIPEHVLGTEVMRRALGFGIKTATWRGRGYTFDGVPMCADTEAVDLAEQVGMSAGASVCGNPKKDNGQVCPHFRACLYQQQRQPASAADLVVIAHNHLFQSLPAEVRENLGLVVIDESFWQAALRARDITLETFAADAISHPVLKRDGLVRQVTDEAATNDLHVIRAKVVTALAAAPDGYLTQEHVTAAGITPEDCAVAKKLEWRRQRDVEMWPGMPKNARKDAHAVAIINKQIPRMAAFWNALGTLLSGDDAVTGRIELLIRSDKRGDVRVALVNERREFCKDVLAQPLLLLDGTGKAELVREFLPEVEVLAEARPLTPHVTTRQVVGPLSKTSLSGRAELVGELVDFVRLKAAGDTALVISNLEIEASFQNIPGISTVHYGAMAGRDEWGGVRHLFVTGGTMPNPDDTRAMAAQLTGRPVPFEQPVRSERGVLMADGSGVTLQVPRYANDDLDAIRSSVADANLIQAIGRGRGVNRTAETPLDVWVLGTVVHPYPVSDLMRWSDVALNPVQRMAARGVVFTSPTDARKAFPDLFSSAEAAKKALQRATSDFGDKPLLESIIRECPRNTPTEVSYRPKGRGQNKRTAYVSPGRLDGFRAWLEGVVGPLADFQVGPAPVETPESELPFANREAELIDPGAIYPKTTPSSSVINLRALFTIKGAQPRNLICSDTGHLFVLRFAPKVEQTARPVPTIDADWLNAPVSSDQVAAGLYAYARNEPVQRPNIRLPQLHVGPRPDPAETARLQAEIYERMNSGKADALAAEMIAFIEARLMRDVA